MYDNSTIPTDFCLDTTRGTNENTGVAIPSKTEQRLTRCAPAEGVYTTPSRGRSKSKFLPAMSQDGVSSNGLVDQADGRRECLCVRGPPP